MVMTVVMFGLIVLGKVLMVMVMVVMMVVVVLILVMTMALSRIGVSSIRLRRQAKTNGSITSGKVHRSEEKTATPHRTPDSIH
ncbi:hypothetical protein E2C01_048818 [Portunus trituberculatus]|uniref:Uncharacterized protein n=1 Tax=Portunus trituberculatus TaxID=210409 RepID=A0A5B7GB67_PORTR|nr:hypothetical protein [Portunus trituberculatus]